MQLGGVLSTSQVANSFMGTGWPPPARWPPAPPPPTTPWCPACGSPDTRPGRPTPVTDMTRPDRPLHYVIISTLSAGYFSSQIADYMAFISPSQSYVSKCNKRQIGEKIVQLFI